VVNYLSEKSIKETIKKSVARLLNYKKSA